MWETEFQLVAKAIDESLPESSPVSTDMVFRVEDVYDPLIGEQIGKYQVSSTKRVASFLSNLLTE